MWLTNRLLQLRKENSKLFTEGEYIPLDVKGKLKENIIAFARRYRDEVLITIAPLHLAEICSQQKKEWQELDWGNTKIVLPNTLIPVAQNIFSSEKLEFDNGIQVKQVLREIPFAILKGSFSPNKRGAGILLHISSLPSPFGIGDLGPEAKALGDFLHRSYQRFWQLLPLNPTEQGQAHSPWLLRLHLFLYRG